MNKPNNIEFRDFCETLGKNNEKQGFSENYLRHALRRGWETFRHLPPGTGHERLLDVGGMNGLFAPAYVDLYGYAHVSVVGNDAPESGVVEVVCQKGLLSMSASQCDIETETWPFPDESFDTIVCTEVLEHMLFDPMFVVNEMSRVLKPHGSVLVTVPNSVSDDVLIDLLNDRQPGYLRYYNITMVRRGQKDMTAIANMGHFHEYTRTELECLFKAGGFKMEQISSFGTQDNAGGSLRFRVLCKALHFLFPRARRLPGNNLLLVAEKGEYLPLGKRASRYPGPLYRTI